MHRLRFHVAYDGTDFHGWQVQPGLPTIQGMLEEIIGSIEGKPVDVIGSGRTDAGVHALAQVAAVTIENPIPPDNFRRAVNRLLPKSIRISSVSEVALNFHPRFDALRKQYEYRIFREEVCPPFERHYVYHHPYPLNERAMIEAAPLLEGEHDFTAFAAADERDALARSRVRRIFHSSLTRSGNLLFYRVAGSGFLKHMVRNMVGVLLEVGKGNFGKDDLLARLQPHCGIRPGPAVPASGLFLVSVEYDEA
ncbi:MAG: tRNA pseudouridine(38-40) synthase TruA [Acidobacteriaceae bacterium]|nr:tRNA pseudouridine(38-40) synthase TruA [Acidobacteriaceae bacterium]MBV9938304.1 tRNA pseudouridine(38-40) synthase TruA [Acidobacteriaceae bacterium]